MILKGLGHGEVTYVREKMEGVESGKFNIHYVMTSGQGFVYDRENDNL